MRTASTGSVLTALYILPVGRCCGSSNLSRVLIATKHFKCLLKTSGMPMNLLGHVLSISLRGEFWSDFRATKITQMIPES